jgi:hypothetical protein
MVKNYPIIIHGKGRKTGRATRVPNETTLQAACKDKETQTRFLLQRLRVRVRFGTISYCTLAVSLFLGCKTMQKRL